MRLTVPPGNSAVRGRIVGGLRGMAVFMEERFSFREEPSPSDPRNIAALVSGTGFFRPDEVAVAVELVEDRLHSGSDSDYRFWFAENADGRFAGYVCYGGIPCTIGAFDLYWIAVDKRFQGRGLGGTLSEMTEESCRKLNGRRIYVETSGKELYEPTRRFYARCGYAVAAVLKDFYDLGDDKIILEKKL